MKKNNRKLFHFIILSFFFFFCPFLVDAEGTAISGFKVVGNPYLEETFDVILYLDEIKGTSDDLGLAGIQGYFYYDKDKLELVSYESLAPYTIIFSENRVVGLGIYEYMNGYQDILRFTFKAKKKGDAIINFPDLDSPDSKAEKVYITGCQETLSITNRPEPLTIDETSIYVLTKTSKKLTVSYNLEGTVTGSWSSENPSIATVSQDGTVTGVSQGITKVIYQTNNGYRVECTVTISNYLKGDVTKNGKVNIKDVMDVMYFYTRKKTPTEDLYIIGDMNNDGKLNLKDANLILAVYLKKF